MQGDKFLADKFMKLCYVISAEERIRQQDKADDGAQVHC